MATLLSTVTADTTGTGASHSGPCTVYCYGTFDDAVVSIQVSDDDTNYVKADNISAIKPSVFRGAGCCALNGRGTYYVRAVLNNAGSSTSVSCTTTQ